MKIEIANFIGTSELAQLSGVDRRTVERHVAAGTLTPDAFMLTPQRRHFALWSRARAAAIAKMNTKQTSATT
jgi:hypothetical protein